jgi:hypothetical protein
VAAAAAKNPEPEARSRHPLFKGQRLVVFDWMLDDAMRLLGEHTEAFDLHAWFYELDERCVREGLVIRPRDGGKWLNVELLLEAQRRGLPLRFATVDGEPTDEAAKWAEVARRGPTTRGTP